MSPIVYPEHSLVWHPYDAESAVLADLEARVHVWRARLDDVSTAIGDNLAEDERARANRFRRPEDRHRFVAARSILRTILADLLERSGESHRLRFGYGRAGKPFLVDDPHLRFNVSHSENLVVIAATRTGEVGIDVEQQRHMTDMDGIARMVFSDVEQAAIQGCPEAGRDLVFYRIWTRKEALLKAMGIGLTALGNPEAASISHGGGAWFLNNLPHLDGYIASLVRPRSAYGLRLWSWPNALGMRSTERRSRPRPMPAARPSIPLFEVRP